MKKWCGPVALLVILCSFYADVTAQPQYAFRVSFTDKSPTAFSLSNPSAYLSQRSIDRRAKYSIPVDSLDLPVAASYLDSVLQETNSILHSTSRWHNSCIILSPDSAATASVLQQLTFVAGFKKVAYYSSGLHQKPGPDPDTAGTPVLKPTDFDANFYGAAWSQIHLCNGEYLHEQGFMGEEQLIAVIDVGFTGVNTAAPFDSMFAQGRLIDTWNYIYDTAHVFGYGSHGSQVLSCMAAYVPETFVGTAPKAMYALYATDDLQSEQAIEEDNFAAAVERADSLGADLINTSLGYNTFDDPADSHVYSDLDGNTTIPARAANIATRKGIMVVASAGNEGNNAWHHILTPGDADSAMTAGSVDTFKNPASSSGRGPNAAGTLKPNVSAQGVMAAVVLATGQTSFQSGTSYATPVLAGLTACLMQALPEKPPLEIRTLLESVAHLAAAPNNDVGHGVPDFKKAYDLTSISTPDRADRLFVLYPNPAQYEVRLLPLSGSRGKILDYKLTDLSGRVLLQGMNKTGDPLRLHHLPQGMYLLQLAQDQYRQTSKLLIRR